MRPKLRNVLCAAAEPPGPPVRYRFALLCALCWTLGAGAQLAVNFIPGGLQPLYGGSNPIGAMGFVRVKLH